MLDRGMTIRIVAVGMAWAIPSHGLAHKLEAEYRVLPGGTVRLECWFETGDSAKGAAVVVYRPGGEKLAEGKLDEDGVFTFAPGDVGPVRVVINAGGGHRKEFTIPTEHLRNSAASQPVNPDTVVSPGTEASPSVRSSSVSLRDWIIGIGFVLALAAFWVSLRNAKEIYALRKRLGPPTPGAASGSPSPS
ncbi:MAG: hypothetical protein NZ700_08285 [Gemmataceae bacterium]|nr:hypothetical protein [Gemmataceae bacterium]MDW8267315.1 hypothetical protein [Gemmataceae bacterium]